MRVKWILAHYKCCNNYFKEDGRKWVELLTRILPTWRTILYAKAEVYSLTLEPSSSTVWKSTQKRYHAQKFSVKPHNKNMLILLLQMHDFLLFVGIFWSSGLIEFSRLVYMLEFLVKTFLNHLLQLEISFAQNRATFNACIYFSYQTFPGISMPNGSSDPPLPRYIEKPCANLREKLLFAIS